MPGIGDSQKDNHQKPRNSGRIKPWLGRGISAAKSNTLYNPQRPGRTYSTSERERLGYLERNIEQANTTHYRHNLVNNRRSIKEETAIPDPIPDTGYHNTKAEGYTSYFSHSTRHKHNEWTSLMNSAATFSVIPPTLSVKVLDKTAASWPTPIMAIPATTSLQDSNDVTPSVTPSISQQDQHKSSTTLIVCLAVGSVVLIAGSLLLFRLFTRPIKRPRPRPSLPILDDEFSEDKRMQDGSPIFGGQERSSFRPGSGGTWTWTQYCPAALTANDQSQTSEAKDTLSGYGSVGYSPRLGSSHHGGANHQFLRPPSDDRVTGLSNYTPTLQQIKSSITNTASRFSAASVSLYPTSPQQDEIGIAIGGTSPQTAFTGDGHHALCRKESRKSLDQNRIDELDHSAGIQRKRRSQAGPCAYDGVELESPIALPYRSPEQPVPRAGRTRVKSSYYATGSYPRSSRFSAHKSSRSEGHLSYRRPDQSQGSLPSMVADVSTNGDLTILSPQPSIYPDDSISVAGCRKPARATHKKKSENMSVKRLSRHPTEDESAEPVIKSSTSNTCKRLSASEAMMSRIMKSNLDDKPPYLPLPVPLPSLSQMALESANPQAYTDYRSPTYSIYGFYEAEARSLTR